MLEIELPVITGNSLLSQIFQVLNAEYYVVYFSITKLKTYILFLV